MDSFADASSGLPNELKFMCALIRSEDNDSHLTLLSNLTREGFDWDIFIKFVDHHRVYPLVYERLSKLKASTIPVNIMDLLREMYKRNMLFMMSLTAEMHAINECFDKENIPVIMLKGPVLSQELFGNISSRTSKDLDIYIPIKDIDRAEALLLESGYSATNNNYRVGRGWKWREHHMSFINKSKNIQVELHWRLSPDTDREPSFDELWERRVTSYPLGKQVYLLSNEDLFMYLVWHGSRHGWFRLRWLVDIKMLLEKTINWSKLYSLLSMYHCKHYASQALILSEHLFETSIPLNFHLQYKKKYTPSFILDVFDFISNIKTKSVLAPSYKKQLFLLKSTRQKIVYIVSRLYPNSWDSAAIPLPRQLQFLYFILRPFIIIWRHFKTS
ncbi:hypothetical protein BK138_14930 [Paenibacillus rhizosphaerae]|uniref:Renal dipeptidase n=1 Tax=Paenibacillus rhizosphaerae TaxID=297318 RepID=A0A1R1ERK3_9BACL|nr:nucleotidyltransferase family protein [Paenibacillus rhizosphaerae]OMF54466.1 hypothetical protein BK138_14930 [Paenibacillus rhizosphaerae]